MLDLRVSLPFPEQENKRPAIRNLWKAAGFS